MLGAARAFDVAAQIGRNPATVKVARLGLDALARDEASVHLMGIKCQVVGDWRKARRWVCITPRCSCRAVLAYNDIPVTRLPLPFAHAPPRCRDQLGSDRVGWDVVSRCMVRFENTPRIGGLDNRLAAKIYPKYMGTWFKRGRSRVVLDVFWNNLDHLSILSTYPNGNEPWIREMVGKIDAAQIVAGT